MKKPIIAITMGDPAGIGPELIAKVLSRSPIRDQCRPIVIGDVDILADACARVLPKVAVRAIDDLRDAEFSPTEIEVFAPEGLHLNHVTPGQVSGSTGKAAAQCLEAAYRLAMAGAVHGVVYAPMHKGAFHMAGYDYLDEIEYLADLAKCQEPVLIGVIGPSLLTTAVTLHVPFRSIADLVTRANVLMHIKRLDEILNAVGAVNPRIAVAALNVHGGEGGLFGSEEADEIVPAIEDARAQGLRVDGPCPADTVFVRARAGEFAGVVCMYHDQANIARKLLATMSGATLVLGLPVIFGTTAHGTALDKAGKGIADTGSLEAAWQYATLFASHQPGSDR